MIAPIDRIATPTAPELTAPGGAASPAATFKSVLENAITGVEQTRLQANESVTAFLNGQDVELHTTVLAAQKAELSFEMFLQMRNKVVQAYQEIMRSQI
jgi:flagellar hook-basal body complex protein FliE